MKILTSYFYQIRFFKPNMIPLSTCLSDPVWYHKGNGKSFYYKDKNGVWNGLRAEPFVPKTYGEDTPECPGHDFCNQNPDSCALAMKYYSQLEKLNFEEIYQRFINLGNKIKDYDGFEEEPIMVLIVYEAPTNPCSERGAIQAWFKENGYLVEEFSKDKVY